MTKQFTVETNWFNQSIFYVVDNARKSATGDPLTIKGFRNRNDANELANELNKA